MAYTKKRGMAVDGGEKFDVMTSSPVERLVLRMALPPVVIMLISAMYNAADTYFVGYLGTTETAAVGVSFSLMNVIQAAGFLFGHGAGNYISRALGARNGADAEKMAATGFFTAFFAGSVITAAGLVFLSPLALALGATPTILPYALSYLRFILLGAPFMVSALTINNILRFQGNSFLGMIGMTSGALLNVFLDPLFIFTFGMGISGAALATMISQTVSCVLLFIINRTGKQNVPILFRNFSPGKTAYLDILRGGSPSLLRQSVMSLAAVCLNRAAGPYGDAVIAAVSIVNRVVMISGSAVIGLGQGFQPVCGFNYGAKLYGRVKRAFWFCLAVSSVILAVLSVLGFLFAPAIIAAFRKDDAGVIRVGALALRLQSLTLPLTGWIVLNNMMLQTMGKALPANILAFARQGFFLIPLLFTLTPLLGVTGIVLSAPVADLCTFVLALPLGIMALKRYLG
ncbi:MAG: MATE family efflux transporter [Treponema sp.]|jgi:putative MATE family efflux protein|nr:MATE family efflux transporter [Treponema sp.]